MWSEKERVYRRRLFKTISPAMIFFIRKYLNTEKKYSYKGIHLKIFPGVFHPGFFFSTKILLNYLNGIDLKNKKLLELGAGSGLISIYSVMKGADVTSTDISKTAIKNLYMNSKLNNIFLEIIKSDLFDSIPYINYDYIIVNPPYYDHDPINENEFAWFCGKGFQYFRKLFEQLNRFSGTETKIIMILSEECAVQKIKSIAEENSVNMIKISENKNWMEKNFLFQLIPAIPSKIIF